MKTPVLLLALVPAFAAAPSSSLQFVPTPNSTAQGVVPMSNGSVAIFGAVNNNGCTITTPGTCDQTQTPLLSILNASGNQTAALGSSALGSGNSNIAGAAIDANGNIWITGNTDSDDFPLVHPLYTQKADYQKTGFVAKLDPNFNIVFSTLLGGQPARGQTIAVAVALDSAGNAFVTGSTDDPNFPTTGPVFGVGVPSGNSTNPLTYTFLVKISPDGSTLLFSRLLGGNQFESQCFLGCLQNTGVATIPYAIAVDTGGNLTVAGGTNAVNFPVTANVYQGDSAAFVTRISWDGSRLVWSTGLGGPSQNFGSAGFRVRPGYANSVAVDVADNVYVTGITAGSIPTTPGALPSPSGYSVGFAVKLSADATQAFYATNLPGTLAGVALDSAGNAWITGNTNYSSNFPGLSNVPFSGLDFALELNSDASAVQQIFTFLPPTSTQQPAFDSNGNLLLLASAGNLLRLNEATALTAPAVFAVTNSAVQRAAAGLASGELATLYGVGLGPANGIPGEPDQNGLYPTQLGGVSVKIGGVAAPLLYVGLNQINLQVPFFGGAGPTVAAYPTSTTVVITTPNGVLPPLQPQAAGSLGIFGVVNPDGSVNSASNPAPDGSTVMVYLTGLGEPESQSPGGCSSTQNGAISHCADSVFLLDVEVKYLDIFFGVTYAGSAPGLINGVDQVNVQLPAGVAWPQIVIQTLPVAYTVSTGSTTVSLVGPSVTSNLVTVYTY